MAKLTDKQRKRIIADRVDGLSLRKLADKYHVSVSTIRNVLESDTEIAQKFTHKKEENSADILAHMEAKRDKVNEIIDVYLERLLDPEILTKATPSQLTTALGTLIDKFTMLGVVKTGAKREEDPLTKALREEAEALNNADK